MNFKELESKQKLRGGYYTPDSIAFIMSEWALAKGAKHILEPSFGDGVFLRAIQAIVERDHKALPEKIEAIEIFQEEAEKAAGTIAALKQHRIEVDIEYQDFFEWFALNQNKSWDAIVGNPPYIRYQYFDNEQRKRAEAIFRAANVPFSKRTNAWVPFVIASVMNLAPGGRLAMVIPSELLHIQHANGLRLLLEQEMESVTLVSIRDLVFDDVLQGVLLLLAVKRKTRGFEPVRTVNGQLALSNNYFDSEDVHLKIIDVDSIDVLQRLDLQQLSRQFEHVSFQTHGHWMYALLSSDEQTLINQLRCHDNVLPFSSIADVDIGIVTGANDFFVVDNETMSHYNLESISSPMLAKGDLIQGIIYSIEDHQYNSKVGKSVNFLSFPATPPKDLPPKMVEYISTGEQQGLHTRYKCRIRTPWYVVPYVWSSELALLKRSYQYPKLVINELGAYSTDTAYRIRLLPKYIDRAKDLAFSFLNSLTFLTAELEGRHYAGGVLELVPSEVERLLIPLTTIDSMTLDKVDQMIRNKVSLEKIVEFTDPIILGNGMGLNLETIEAIQSAHRRLLKRRLRL